MTSFSIVICTYNPDPVIFRRLLKAVLNFDVASPAHEVIIVDNNSSPALSANKEVQLFLEQKPNASLVIETSPGLTAARITGIKKATHDWIVFFDDDNEPAYDYLKTAADPIEKFPQVGAWGPGTVEVEYTQSVESWINSKKEMFQQRNENKSVFAKERTWENCYPFGTGMLIRKEIAVEYMKRVKNKRYTLTDRKGKSLASGGDVQMVLTGIEIGFAAGTIAKLSLNHLIDTSKANLAYLIKQQYGTTSAYIKAYNQVFLDEQIEPGIVTNFSILKIIYGLYRIHKAKLHKNDFKLLIASKMGEMNAAVSALGSPKPLLLKMYERFIHA